MKYKFLLIVALICLSQKLFTADEQELKNFCIIVQDIGALLIPGIKRTDTLADLISTEIFVKNLAKGLKRVDARLVDYSSQPESCYARVFPHDWAVWEVELNKTVKECGLWDNYPALKLHLYPLYEKKDLTIRTLTGQNFTIKMENPQIAIISLKMEFCNQIEQRSYDKISFSYKGVILTNLTAVNDIPGLWEDPNPVIHAIISA